MHLTQTDRTQPQMLESVEMERKCWALRVEGLSYEQIVREVGLGSRAAAWKAVKKALDRYHEEIREDAFCYIRQQNDQIDILTQVYFERARNGDIQAVHEQAVGAAGGAERVGCAEEKRARRQESARAVYCGTRKGAAGLTRCEPT